MFICVKSFFLRPSRRITGNSFRGSSITLTAISAPTGATVAVVRLHGDRIEHVQPAQRACQRGVFKAAEAGRRFSIRSLPRNGFST